MSLNAIKNQRDDSFEIVNRPNGEVVLVKYRGNESTVVVPDGVTVIGNEAFLDRDVNTFNTTLVEVILPESVTSIRNSAFNWCKSLRNVVLNEGLTTIGFCAFRGCPLSSVLIPSTVTKIDFHAFSGCPLKSVFIPSTVTDFDASAFDPGVAITVSEDNPCFVTVDGAVYTTDKKKLVRGVDVEEFVVLNGVTAIDEFAFAHFKNIRKVFLPDSLMEIGYGVFCESAPVAVCLSLSVFERIAMDLDFHVRFELEENPELVSRDGSVFTKDFKTLIRGAGDKEYVVPDGVTTIGEHVFGNDPYVEKVVVSEGVTTICDCAFTGSVKDYNSLRTVVLPSTLKTIGCSAFVGCWELSSIDLPEGLLSIGNSAFYECRNLGYVRLPESITSIGYGAFYGCKELELKVPNSVREPLESFWKWEEWTDCEDEEDDEEYDEEEDVDEEDED